MRNRSFDDHRHALIYYINTYKRQECHMVGKDFVTLTERAYYNITAMIEDFILFTRSYVKLDAEWLQILRLKC